MKLLRRCLLVSASTGALIAGASGCGSTMHFMGQSATLQSGVMVNFLDAYGDEEFTVKIQVTNMTQAHMMVNRDEFGLRLPDGRVLPRAGGVHGMYVLPPGGSHPVFVKFVDPGRNLGNLTGASVIVGGISFSTDPRSRVVGEIALVPVAAPR